MPTPTTQPPFGEISPHTQPAAPAALTPGRTTAALAERHEALWLSLTALHKDIIALGAKKPAAPVSEPVRVVAEGLLSDCAPYIRKRRDRLPVAAPDLAGLTVQLGQALAGLDAWESRHTTWDARSNCRVWQVAGEPLPVRRLRPAIVPPGRDTADDVAALRQKVARHIEGKAGRAYAAGFRDGRDAPAAAPAAQTYPRLGRLD